MGSKYAYKKGGTLEKRVAEDFGGKTSKRGPDVITDDLLIECKVRDEKDSKGSKQITIKKEWLTKVTEQAEKEGRIPALAFRFAGDKSYWIVVSDEVFRNLLRERSP